MKAPDIFQVEDDADFSLFMEHAVAEIDNNLHLKIVTNGKEAMLLLKEFQLKSSKPGMILLDINLPGISGLEILKAIREIEFFRTVPIIIFSTSDNPKDITATIEFGANGYQIKPMGYRGLVNCLKAMHINYLKTN